MLCAYAFAQCSLYGRGRINIKENLQSYETALPLISRRFFQRGTEKQNYNLGRSAVIIQKMVRPSIRLSCIERYCRLLATELTDLERQYLHKRIAEEHAQLDQLEKSQVRTSSRPFAVYPVNLRGDRGDRLRSRCRAQLRRR
jgi:hypothetical protein